MPLKDYNATVSYSTEYIIVKQCTVQSGVLSQLGRGSLYITAIVTGVHTASYQRNHREDV